MKYKEKEKENLYTHTSFFIKTFKYNFCFFLRRGRKYNKGYAKTKNGYISYSLFYNVTTTTIMSKAELAQALGFIFPSHDRVDYKKLFKKVNDTGLLEKLGMTPTDYIEMHKERFSNRQSNIIKNHFQID
jgi:hypothetical protein